MRRALCLGLLLTAWSTNAYAGPLAPTKASQIVVLTAAGTPCSADPDATAVNLRNLPDGTIAPFTIPAGQVLVVTGIAYSVSGGIANVAKNVSLFTANPPFASVLFLSGLITGDTALGRLGGGSASIPNAIVKAGIEICVQASEINGAPANVSAVVYGFLAKDK